MDSASTDTIDRYQDPLGFKVRPGSSRLPLIDGRRDVIRVEARQMAGHQKEAVVTEGAGGSAWRLTSDEGKHLKGTDLAPFPLGFFNAGLQCDLYGRIRAITASRGIEVGHVAIRLVNHYWLTGSFIQGTGEGHAEAPDIEVSVQSPASSREIHALVDAAADASPAYSLIRTPLHANTFALYINGRRRRVAGVANSTAADAADPYRTYTAPPRPYDPNGPDDVIMRTEEVEVGAREPAAATITGKQIRNVIGEGTSVGKTGRFEVATWVQLPGMTHFRIASDESGSETAPLGLSLLSAGISFCYMTQLSRYIENMRMKIRRVRLVQFNPYIAGAKAGVGPIDTHLFLDGEAPEETHQQLLTIAARTCYLHAAAKTPWEPKLRIIHNGAVLGQAA